MFRFFEDEKRRTGGGGLSDEELRAKRAAGDTLLEKAKNAYGPDKNEGALRALCKVVNKSELVKEARDKDRDFFQVIKRACFGTGK